MRLSLPLAVVLLLILLGGSRFGGVARAEVDEPRSSGASDASDTLAAEDARARLEALEEEIDVRHAELETFRDRWQEALDRRHAAYEDLAREVEQSEAEAARLAERRRRLGQAIEEGGIQDELEATTRSLRHAAHTAAERLAIHLREIPPLDGVEDVARRVIEALAAAEDESRGVMARSLALERGLRDLLPALDHVHRDASLIRVRETDIHTAEGQIERVRLLSVGHVAFAYEVLGASASTERVGIALESPADASGYRFTEALPESTLRQIRKTFASLDTAAARAATAPVAVSIPVDPSGQLRVEDWEGEEPGIVAQLRAGGPVMLPLGLVALLAVGLIAERGIRLFGPGAGRPAESEAVIELARAGHFLEAEARFARLRGPVARTLEACLEARKGGPKAMEDAVEEQLLQEHPRLRRFLGGLAVLAVVSPLLGLLGTVTGIIETFAVIQELERPSPALMSAGISEALTTTATGLALAIPVLLAHSLLSGRVERLIAEAEGQAAALHNAIAHGQQGSDT